MKSILLFVLLAAVHLVAAFHCPPNVTQHLLDSDNQTYRYEVAIQNDSPYFLREIIMLPSSNVTVEGMNVSEAGIRFPFRALPPHKTHHWTYTHDSAEPATFDVVVAECVNHTRHHHNHHGNHTHSSNDTRPTVAPTANPSNDTVPTANPTANPTARPTSTPTSNPTSSPTSAPTSGATSAPTSTPTSSATSAPTSSATSAPTASPTSSATSAATASPSATSAPTVAATSALTAAATSAPTAAATSAPTAAATSAPTAAATSAPTAAATSAPTAAATSGNTTTTISGTCSGTPRMLNGKPCASTTRYWDGNLGACGCGDSSGAFAWVASSYTAAASPPLFGTATNCGTGCGKCYQLTATGYSPAGTGATAGQTITVMVTNLCPAGGDWCASGTNSYEYGAHFDLADSPTAQLITKLGWDNPEVVYEEVSCSGTLTPTAADAAECTCTSS